MFGRLFSVGALRPVGGRVSCSHDACILTKTQQQGLPARGTITPTVCCSLYREPCCNTGLVHSLFETIH